MTTRDVDVWLPYVDAYVDGTLDEQDALRLRVAANSSPALAAAVDRVRALHAALDRMPVAEPSAAFDERILHSVPLARYVSAPRRAPIVVALGELTPGFVQHWVARLGRGLSALATAWLLAVIVGSTALQGQLSAGAAALGARLQLWADTTASSALLGPVARGLSAAYDACFGALGSMAGTVGLGLTIFLLGAALGGIGLWAAARRRPAGSGRAEHHA